MPKATQQMFEWMGTFGRAYTDRNALSLEEMEVLYRNTYGVTRTELNQRFLDPIDQSACILEVGSNIGNQLQCLQKMGFSNLYGIELQPYAVELSKMRTRYINIIQGSAFDIPFEDGHFDLVFTSGLLSHIFPADLKECLEEIHRCTREYIWGFEAYADATTHVTYRGHAELMWKGDYAQWYLRAFSDLELVKEERVRYLDSENIDSMFLLRRK